jgi:hypothetical protein
MIKTEFYDAFLDYYDKAATLQYRNCGNAAPDTKCGDPIMDNISIYDTVNRKYAGFSKALEDVHGVRCENHLKRYPDYSDKLDIVTFHFIHLFHRFTGSGASFRPIYDEEGYRRDDEHGYYNNHVNVLCDLAQRHNLIENRIKYMKKYIVNNKLPMVTSIGNQPPSLKNGDPSKYRLAQQYYFDNYAEDFIRDYISYIRLACLQYHPKGVGIKEAVDFCCRWHKDRGFKQWHFVLTAFVMDTAEYYPELVDRDSHCYYGANCIKSFKLIFEKEKSDKMKNAEFYEKCMQELVTKRPQSKPYDMEDVCCDFIRYVVEYKPKGYDHLNPDQCKNNSVLKLNGEYTEAQKQRINKILKTSL